MSTRKVASATATRPGCIFSRPLSKRQGEAFALFEHGLERKEVAATMGLSENTLSKHIKGILKKVTSVTANGAAPRNMYHLWRALYVHEKNRRR